MTDLWCILVPFGAYFTVSGIPCFQCSKTKNIENTLSSDSNLGCLCLRAREDLQIPGDDVARRFHRPADRDISLKDHATNADENE